VFLVEPPAGQPARSLQSRCFDNVDIVDAVPEGGLVRLVARGKGQSGEVGSTEGLLSGLAVHAAPARFEDGFMWLLNQQGDKPEAISAGAVGPGFSGNKNQREVVIEVRDLVKKFGAFTAVDQVSFQVYRGEIFGLLGPNGAGKTTTFRMLCGLLAATSGRLRVAGEDLRVARASARQRIGYVAQKFALYGQLSVIENLGFFASAYGLRGQRKRDRLDWALQHFGLSPLAKLPSEQLPGGYKQRLSMAAALLHEPEILFLDEPTSGADPLARREFWRRITAFAEQGVTVIVTTHFMEEAEYCDRALIQDAGRLLEQGTPAEIRQRVGSPDGPRPSMEEAFIAIVEQSRETDSAAAKEAV
jgi:ABC-2 type transport system ATP-binding protein